MNTKLKIYIIHYKGYEDRKLHMSSILENIDFEYEFIENFDKEELNQALIDKVYQDSESEFNKKVELWGERANSYVKLRRSEISVAVKFVKTFEKINKESYEYALIIEDDCIPVYENFMKEIEKLIQRKPSWDLIFVGEGMSQGFRNDKIGIRRFLPFIKSFRMSHPATNTTDAILVKKSSIPKILDNLTPMNLVIDWELAYQFYIQDMNIHWSKKNIFKQGSKNNIFDTEMR